MCAGLAKWEISLPPSQFCCKFKTAPQNIVLKNGPQSYWIRTQPNDLSLT